MPAIDTVKLSVEGALGVITLDRPKALNALDNAMCLAIDDALVTWAKDDTVAAVVIRSSSGRAFCAGGDVRMVREHGLARRRGESKVDPTNDFFRDEYRMNRRIKTFPKPFVALMDGITMGGGVGLSIHGSHRVATETSLWAMPETAIGLFPDVGTSYALPRLPGEFGTYLALTGARLGPADLKALGIATAIAPGMALPNLIQALIDGLDATTQNPGETVSAIIDRHAINGETAALIHHRATIDRCFKFDAVETIMDALRAEPGDFAAETRAILSAMSPTSLKVTLREMRRGRDLDFDACLRMEYALARSMLEGHDFYEGVRAQLVDKDKKPFWRPASLDLVDEDMVDGYFRETEGVGAIFQDDIFLRPNP
jgi:enoyl-CoA hydratase